MYCRSRRHCHRLPSVAARLQSDEAMYYCLVTYSSVRELTACKFCSMIECIIHVPQALKESTPHWAFTQQSHSAAPVVHLVRVTTDLYIANNHCCRQSFWTKIGISVHLAAALSCCKLLCGPIPLFTYIHSCTLPVRSAEIDVFFCRVIMSEPDAAPHDGHVSLGATKQDAPKAVTATTTSTATSTPPPNTGEEFSLRPGGGASRVRHPPTVSS